ncbi:MAG TPA: hypothetical protein VMT75_07370 [Candidatus Saccharimonadales bacterium]|nr:hypothetical protein [Candidatus Saccharimonadales bacterium]
MQPQLAEELRAKLQDFLSAGLVQIRDATSRLTPAAPLLWEVRGAESKPLLHLWTDNCNLTRRVLGILEQSDDHLLLAVERFGKSRPDRLELVRVSFQRSAKIISREEFCDRLERILAEQFPDEEVEKISVAADLEHTLSRKFVRGVSRKGPTRCAFLAVPEDQSPDALDSSLTYGLLWLDRARQAAANRNLSFLRLILPLGNSTALAHRLAALSPQLAVQVYELDLFDERIVRVEPCKNGNVSSWLVPRRESQLLLDRSEGALASIVASAPEAITRHAVPAEQEVALRFRGLAFARWSEKGTRFGITTAMEELTSATQHKLDKLVKYLKRFRDPGASDTRHALYRAQPERWMQSLIAQDITRIDLNLDGSHLYEQVFAQAAGQHGVIDLLTVTRSHRLAILELKASENPDLPLQAANYWERVRRHQVEGHFAQYGYFNGLELQPMAPLVYLVAPALRFHPTTDTLLRYLTPEMEVVRVGLAESWRGAFAW